MNLSTYDIFLIRELSNQQLICTRSCFYCGIVFCPFNRELYHGSTKYPSCYSCNTYPKIKNPARTSGLINAFYIYPLIHRIVLVLTLSMVNAYFHPLANCLYTYPNATLILAQMTRFLPQVSLLIHCAL